MTSLDEILHYLDTTSRVSCPSITCEQAAEIAAMLRSEESPLVNRTLKKWLEEANRDRGELTKQVYKLQSEVELLEGDLSGSEFQLHETENLQQAACGFAWDCGREMAEKNEEQRLLLKDTKELDAVTYSQLYSKCREVTDERDELKLKLLDAEAHLAWARDDAKAKAEFTGPHCWTCGRGTPNNPPLKEEATGDIDPGVYEGTGRGFEK